MVLFVCVDIKLINIIFIIIVAIVIIIVTIIIISISIRYLVQISAHAYLSTLLERDANLNNSKKKD